MNGESSGEQESLRQRIESLARVVEELNARLEALEKAAGGTGASALPQATPPRLPEVPSEIPPASGLEVPPPPEVPGPPPVPPAPDIPPPAILLSPRPVPQPPGTAGAPAPHPRFSQQGAPPVSPLTPEAAGPRENWQTRFERFLGGRGAMWASLLAIFFAVGLFLRYSWQYLGEWGRLGIGAAVGIVLVTAGARVRGRLERWFGDALMGGGLALLYLTVWAAGERYGVIRNEAAFLLMALVCAAGVALAVRFDALSLIILATLGGFLTPALVGGKGAGGGPALTLLIYIAVLNGGILAVSLVNQWRPAVLLSFASTVLLLLGWADTSYSPEVHRWQVFWFSTLYFLMFLGASIFRSLLQREETAPADLLLLFTSSLTYAMAGNALLHDASGRFPGAFPLALSVFFGCIAVWTARRIPGNRTLRFSTAALGILFLTLSVPAQLNTRGTSSAWSVEAAALLTLGYRFRDPLFRTGGQIVWLIALLAVLWSQVEPAGASRVALLDGRAFTLLFFALANAWIAGYGQLKAGDARDEMTGVAGASALFAAAWLAGLESFRFFELTTAPHPLDPDTRAALLMSVLWTALAAAAYGAGVAARFRAVRMCALVLLAAGLAVAPVAAAGSGSSPLTPFANIRLFAFAFVSAMAALTGWMASRASNAENDPEGMDAGTAQAAAVGAWLLLGIGLSFEIAGAVREWAHLGPAGTAAVSRYLLCAFWGAYSGVAVTLGRLWLLSGLGWSGVLAGSCAATVWALLGLNAMAGEGVDFAPLWNVRFLSLASIAAAGAFSLRMLPDAREGRPSELSGPGWLALVVYLLWGLTVETWSGVRHHQAAFGDWRLAAQIGISAVWALYGLALLVGGMLRDNQAVRVTALIILALTTAKVFVLDLISVDAPYRIVSFLVLGLVLLRVALYYSRVGSRNIPS